MNDTNQSLTVNAQYVKELTLKNVNAPKSLMNLQEPPQVNIGVDVKANKFSDEVFEVLAVDQTDAKSKGADCFTAEVIYAGLFTIKGIPADQLQTILLVECPRLLFPFARAIIAETTREAGFAPLLVHPIDFMALYRQQSAGAQPPKPAVGARPNA